MKLVRVKEIPTLQKHHWHAFSHKTKRDGDDWSWISNGFKVRILTEGIGASPLVCKQPKFKHPRA
jgi:hypothetical protein